MGLFDKKSTSNQTTNDYTTTNTVNATDQRAAGDNSIIGGNVSAQNISGDVSMTDYGAIEKSYDFATGAIDGATNLAANSMQLADRATTNALLFGESALQANTTAMGEIRNITGQAFDTVFKNSKAALDMTENVNTAALGFAGESQKGAMATVDKVSANLAQVARDAMSSVAGVVKGANTSDSVQTIQYVMGGVIAIAVVFLLLNTKGAK